MRRTRNSELLVTGFVILLTLVQVTATSVDALGSERDRAESIAVGTDRHSHTAPLSLPHFQRDGAELREDGDSDGDDKKDDAVLLWGLDHKNSVILRSLICVGLVALAGTVSGLTLSIFSINIETLHGLRDSGDPTSEGLAKRLLGLQHHEHWVLVTLLVCNAAAVEALPLMLDPLMPKPAAIGIAVSTLLVLVFGEVIPQSVFVRFAFPVAGRLVPFVWLIMVLTAPISWSLAKLLDFVVGHRAFKHHRRTELREMVFLNLRERMRQAAEAQRSDSDPSVSDDDFSQGDVEHLLFRSPSQVPPPTTGAFVTTSQPSKTQAEADGEKKGAVNSGELGGQTGRTDLVPMQEGLLSIDEARMMVGALSIAEMRINEVMKPISDVFWLRENVVFTPEIAEHIFTSGFSRVPVCTADAPGPDMSEHVRRGTSPPLGNESTSGAKNTAPVRLRRYFVTREMISLIHVNRETCTTKPTDFELFDAVRVFPDDTILALYDKFVAGTSHMAVVLDPTCADPELALAVGIVTYSDVIEAITRTHFHDETDLANNAALQMRIKGIHAARHGLQGHHHHQHHLHRTFPRRGSMSGGGGGRKTPTPQQGSASPLIPRQPATTPSISDGGPRASLLTVTPATRASAADPLPQNDSVASHHGQ